MTKFEILNAIINQITEDKKNMMTSLKTTIRLVMKYIQYHINQAFRLFLWMTKSISTQEHIWRKLMRMSL